MRALSSTMIVLSLVAGMSVGCEGSQSTLDPDGSSKKADDKTDESANIALHGHLSADGAGSVAKGLGGRDLLAVAKVVDISALGSDGTLTPVGKADVKPDGTFDANVAKDDSATGLFILQAKNVGGAVVGSAVLNGIPAFVKGYAVDATVDTATSLKTEVLLTIQRGGTPGIQNYINVVNTYVDAQLANTIATTGAFSSDFTTILGATSDAVVAAEGALESALQKAGLPIDLSVLSQNQVAVVSGLQGAVTKGNEKLVTDGKSLVAGLEAATAKSAAPVDLAIFNAVVNSGAVFNSELKGGIPNADVGFAGVKSLFKLQTELSTDSIQENFQKIGGDPGILDAVTKACATFNTQVAGAKSVGDLEAAKGVFKDVLLGKNDTPNSVLGLLTQALAQLQSVLDEVEAVVAPLKQNLSSALSAAPIDSQKIGEALAKFDAGSQSLPGPLKKLLSDVDAGAISDALKLVEKEIAQ